jgi:hypothetical protein
MAITRTRTRLVAAAEVGPENEVEIYLGSMHKTLNTDEAEAFAQEIMDAVIQALRNRTRTAERSAGFDGPQRVAAASGLAQTQMAVAG